MPNCEGKEVRARTHLRTTHLPRAGDMSGTTSVLLFDVWRRTRFLQTHGPRDADTHHRRAEYGAKAARVAVRTASCTRQNGAGEPEGFVEAMTRVVRARVGGGIRHGGASV